MAQNPINPSVQKTIDLLKKRIPAHIPTQQLILFGSQATGKATQWSDIDIAVISPTFGRNNYEERSQLLELTQDIDWRLELHPLHPDELKNHYHTLAQEIKTFGIPLLTC